ncbi:hypothetical protein GCM10017786_29470 [Amycolatopsis deserti]|uniref:DUF5666 domain-containing protein n=1 Tax=Amycolatopsis deserti TaxID=185696 RepID=A0ABQ3IV93_9PSEU|nr:hypothetical protein [Amycolatopsis deserti]GHE94525.1 hypothetical protein GCM10017786_29470 [Amycolatopsis deserti]
MTTEQQTAPQSREWGAQQPPRKWSARRTVAAAAIAVGVASAGGVAIYAASGSSGSSTTGQGGPGGMGMPGGSPGGLGNALHGEYVVSDGNGGYTTELMQTGTVTEISATSLTAKSDDGYTKTYSIDSGTAVGGNADLSSIASGDTVTVVASLSGDTATADTLTEGDQAGTGGPGAQQGVLPRRDDSTESGSN